MAEPNQPLEQQVQAGQESSNTKKVHDNGNANQINPTEVPRPIVSSDEPFTCQWTNCNVQAGSPDALYVGLTIPFGITTNNHSRNISVRSILDARVLTT